MLWLEAVQIVAPLVSSRDARAAHVLRSCRMTFGKLLFWLLSSRCLVEAGGAYIGVTDVGFVDSVDEFGFIGGTVSWTAPTDLSNVSSYRAWLSSDMDTELADFFKGTGIIIPAEFGWELLKPEATSFDFDRTQRKALFSDLTTRYLQVYTSFGPDRTPCCVCVVLRSMDAYPQDRQHVRLHSDVNFTDNDTRCGYLGGTITFDVDPSVDLSILQFWKVFFALDTSGANATTAWQLPMSFSASDPNEELIGGTVTVHLGHGQYDKFTVMRLYLAFDATGLGRTELASATPFEAEDFILFWNSAPGSSSVVQSIEFNDEDLLIWPIGCQSWQGDFFATRMVLESKLATETETEAAVPAEPDPIFQQLSGTVRWVPGSITVTTHFVVYVAEDEQGTGKLQVSPDVPDNKVTCLTDTFWPCARHQVLKTEAQHPSGCSGTSCTSEDLYDGRSL
eukprot:s2282_g5.t1